jgi:beta-N-acetylhexosaminidase
VIVDIAGPDMTQDDRQLLSQPGVAGVILFARNIVNAQQVRSLCQQLRQQRADLLICIDQEGGRVQRIKQGVTRIPPMAVLGAMYRRDSQQALATCIEIGWLMARELRALGVDLSFAPVLDLDDDFCAAIGDRSFGCDPDSVISLATAFITGMHQAGMGAVGKHFPGHGKVAADSHHELPVDTRSLEQISVDDLMPFNALCTSHLQGIMPAHIVFDSVDDTAVGFSRIWLKQILRKQLGFTGLIFSDDLNMAAAGAGGDYGQRAQAALAAGCDLLLICNNRPAALEVLASVGDQTLSVQAYQQKLRLISAEPSPMNSAELQRSEQAQALLTGL